MQFRYHATLTHQPRRGKQERTELVTQRKSSNLASGTGASCEPDEARARWQPEAYVGVRSDDLGAQDVVEMDDAHGPIPAIGDHQARDRARLPIDRVGLHEV